MRSYAIKITQDAEGKISSINIPKLLSARISNVNGDVEFRGEKEDIPMCLDLLKSAFYSGIKESNFRVLEAGTPIFRRATVVNAAAVLYTVPGGKVFYFFGFDLDVSALNPAAAIGGNIAWNDGVENGLAAVVRAAAGGGGGHADNNFVLPILREGWFLLCNSINANTQVEAAIFGVLL